MALYKPCYILQKELYVGLLHVLPIVQSRGIGERLESAIEAARISEGAWELCLGLQSQPPVLFAAAANGRYDNNGRPLTPPSQ